MLKPVKIRSTVEAAIENIGTYIAALQEGDVLPGERELAEKLQISRNITREALQHFRTLGIIESKPKVGSVVAQLLPANPYAGYMPFIAASQHSFKELLELRFILESGCCECAANNATAQEIGYLQELASKIKELKDDSSRRHEVHKLDIEFHSAIIRLSKNSLLDSLIPLVVEFFSKHYLRHLHAPIRPEGYDEHFEMISALKNKDFIRWRQLISLHLKAYYNTGEV